MATAYRTLIPDTRSLGQVQGNKAKLFLFSQLILIMAISYTPLPNDLSGTLQSLSYEAALLEAAIVLQNYEANPLTVLTTIAVNFGTGNNVATINANIPIDIQSGNSGGFVIEAVTPAAGISDAYNKSPGLNLSSQSITGNILELSSYLQNRESNANVISDNISVSFDIDNRIAVVAASLPFIISANGDVIIEAAAYIDDV